MDTNLLANLEERWELMAEGIRSLKAENKLLQETIESREGKISELEEKISQLNSSVDGLNQDKTHVGSRIQKLLGQFDELDF